MFYEPAHHGITFRDDAIVEDLRIDACASRIPNFLAESRIEATLRGAWRLAHDNEVRSHASLKGHRHARKLNLKPRYEGTSRFP